MQQVAITDPSASLFLTPTETSPESSNETVPSPVSSPVVEAATLSVKKTVKICELLDSAMPTTGVFTVFGNYGEVVEKCIQPRNTCLKDTMCIQPHNPHFAAVMCITKSDTTFPSVQYPWRHPDVETALDKLIERQKACLVADRDAADFADSAGSSTAVTVDRKPVCVLLDCGVFLTPEEEQRDRTWRCAAIEKAIAQSERMTTLFIRSRALNVYLMLCYSDVLVLRPVHRHNTKGMFFCGAVRYDSRFSTWSGISKYYSTIFGIGIRESASSFPKTILYYNTDKDKMYCVTTD